MIVEIFRFTCSSCHQSPATALTSLCDRLSVPAPAPYSCKRATTSYLEPDKSIRPLPASCYSCSAAISLNSINLLLLTTFSPSGLPLLWDRLPDRRRIATAWIHINPLTLQNFIQAINTALTPLTTTASPMAHPTPFSGDTVNCSGFKLQCSLYFEMQPRAFPIERSKIAFMITLLTGCALQWASTSWTEFSHSPADGNIRRHGRAGNFHLQSCPHFSTSHGL